MCSGFCCEGMSALSPERAVSVSRFGGWSGPALSACGFLDVASGWKTWKLKKLALSPLPFSRHSVHLHTYTQVMCMHTHLCVCVHTCMHEAHTDAHVPVFSHVRHTHMYTYICTCTSIYK